MTHRNPLINETLLRMKYARVISLLAERLGIPEPCALELFYRSDTYTCLDKQMYHLHNMGDAYLVDEILLEMERKEANGNEDLMGHLPQEK